MQENVGGRQIAYMPEDMAYVNTLSIKECEELIRANENKLKERRQARQKVGASDHSCQQALQACTLTYSSVAPPS